MYNWVLILIRGRFMLVLRSSDARWFFYWVTSASARQCCIYSLLYSHARPSFSFCSSFWTSDWSFVSRCLPLLRDSHPRFFPTILARYSKVGRLTFTSVRGTRRNKENEWLSVSDCFLSRWIGCPKNQSTRITRVSNVDVNLCAYGPMFV